MFNQLLLKRTLLLSILPFSVGGCDHGGLTDPAMDPQADFALVKGASEKVQSLPFHGSTTGMLVGQTFPAPEGRCPAARPILAEYRGSGTATHLGRFTVVGGECMYFDPTDPGALSSGEGRYRLTAANGDWLHVAYGVTAVRFEAPPSPWVLWTAPVRILEGGGRFEGAKFVGVTWAGGYNAMTHETYSTLDGRIIYDASHRNPGMDSGGS